MLLDESDDVSAVRSRIIDALRAQGLDAPRGRIASHIPTRPVDYATYSTITVPVMNGCGSQWCVIVPGASIADVNAAVGCMSGDLQAPASAVLVWSRLGVFSQLTHLIRSPR